MKKFILKIILFFAIVAIVDIGVGFFGDYLQAHAKGGGSKRINDFALKDCHDVVILGSSRAHHHYDAPFLCDTLGLDVYNAGYDGNGIILAYGLLEMVLERYQPKLVLFDVEPTFDIFIYSQDNNNSRYISLLKPYYNHSEVGRLIKDISTEEWYKAHSGLIRYNSNLISMIQDCYQNMKNDPQGYEPLIGCYDREPEKREYGKGKVDAVKLKYIEKLIQLVQERDIPILFVASPRYGETSSIEFTPVKDICIKYDVPFLDFYIDAEFMHHKEWFREPMHLNQTGAKKFSKIMAKEIEKLLKTNDNGYIFIRRTN